MKARLKRMLSGFLVMMLLLSILPAAVFAAAPTTLYLKPNSNWLVDQARFAAYFFEGDANTWVDMTDSDGDGYYSCKVPSGYSMVIFCRMNPGSTVNNWDEENQWNQTSDLTIPTNGNNCYTIAEDTWDYGGGAWGMMGSCPHPSHNAAGVCSSCGQQVGHSWKDQNCVGCGLACAHNWSSGKCTLCGYGCSIHVYSGGKCVNCDQAKPANKTFKVTLHLMDSLGWGGVCVYIWGINSSGNDFTPSGWDWPGKTIQRDENGLFTVEMDQISGSSKGMGIKFHNNNGSKAENLILSASQLSKGDVELWIQPDPTKGSDGEYACDVTDTVEAQFRSVEMNGNQVTFRYQSSTAKKVYLAGSMNGWRTSDAPMTKGSDGVFTYTTTLSGKFYEYKFVVDGEWTADPWNPRSLNGNNLLFTLEPKQANSNKTITVKLHYYRSDGNYTGWQAWMWHLGNGGQSCTFQADPLRPDGRVATITLDGTTNSYLNFKLGRSSGGNLFAQTDIDNDRTVDLSKVEGGTVHCFLKSGENNFGVVYDNDVVNVGKYQYGVIDYDNARVWLQTNLPLSGNWADRFDVTDTQGKPCDVSMLAVEPCGNGYRVILSRKIQLIERKDIRIMCGGLGKIGFDQGLFDAWGFTNEYTYTGDDLGATWSANSTTFKLWAPVAVGVKVKLYRTGYAGKDDEIGTHEMTYAEKGVWQVTVPGNLHGVYYLYEVDLLDYTVTEEDPYALSAGANGDRSMVLNMDSTDPEGWAEDVSPNAGMEKTDAIIYEMHVREFTIDESSGVKAGWRGKYLGLTQTGTKYVEPDGTAHATGLDYLKELGVTHVQLMPVFDYLSGNEYEENQYAWGYSPKGYNYPEGSYSTDPFNGEVRVNEFKQMVQAFHENGINVVMDVVYNHAHSESGGDYCYNKIVPNYFARIKDGIWQDSTGVGNDFATERSMARKFIIDSVSHWVEEYHIDGFRFDLMGVMDQETMNQIWDTLKTKYPRIMLYGEGWSGKDWSSAPYPALTKDHSATPGIGYFNDDFRNAIAGHNGENWGFASESKDKRQDIIDGFLASRLSPSQSINYVSCHDDYCLFDKINESRKNMTGDSREARIAMNNLSAAIYMLSQGTPFIYSGEELLREKFQSNSEGGGDETNKIRWSSLANDNVQMVLEYYKGLIAFRKNHGVLRLMNGDAVQQRVTYRKKWGYEENSQLLVFHLNGWDLDCSEELVVIFNGYGSDQDVYLADYDIGTGYWQRCIFGDQAGVKNLDNGGFIENKITVKARSATVLVKGYLTADNTVYEKNVCKHTSHNADGYCNACGKDKLSHRYTNGKCTCGKSDPGFYLVGYINGADYGWGGDDANLGNYRFTNGKLTTTFTSDSYVVVKSGDNRQWYTTDGWDGTEVTAVKLYNTKTKPNENKLFVPGGVQVTFNLTPTQGDTFVLGYTKSGQTCSHTRHNQDAACTDCGAKVQHTYQDGCCTVCGSICPQCGVFGTCSFCGAVKENEYYLCGYIKGDNYAYQELSRDDGEYRFVNGKLTVTFPSDSYVAIKTKDSKQWFYAQSYTEAKTGKFYPVGTGAKEKMKIPGGVPVTLTLTQNSDDTLTLSYASGGCTHSYSAKITTVATCTTAGEKTFTCSKCGDSYTEAIPAAGHNFVGGICTTCGAFDGTVVPDTTYYLIGYINGANYGCEEDDVNMGQYKFVDGKLTAKFDTDSFVFVKTEGNTNWYMTDGWLGTDVQSAVLYNTNVGIDANKLFVPGGVEVTFTLTENEDGTLTLSYTTPAAEPSVVPTISMKYPSLSFEDVIIMNVYYTAENLQDVVEMGLITNTVKPSVVSLENADKVIPGYGTEGELYFSSTAGIAPKDIGDTIYFAVYAKLKDGTVTYTKMIGYSPKTYAMNQLSTGSTEMRPLVAAMLNYGAAAQTYFNYKTDALMNATMTDEQKAMAESYCDDMIASVTQASGAKLGSFINDKTYTQRYPTISFEGAFCINYYFQPSLAVKGDVTMYVWSLEDYEAAEVLTKENATKAVKMELTENGEYMAVVDGIAAKDLDKAAYVSFVYSDGTTEHCGGVIAYTIGMYCKSQASGTGTLAELAKACAVYGYYAKQLFNK